LLSFRLSDDFVSQYDNAHVPWGNTDAGGNSVGELIFIRTYSRVKEDGTKETWQDVCRRVIEGMYAIQKDWCKSNRLPWNDRKAQASAQEAFDRMFNLKWTPPGRGLWVTGTEAVHGRGLISALYNCSFISTDDMTRNDPGAIFGWVADALMCGIGVGFDTRGADKKIEIREPQGEIHTYVIPDTREGWAESIRLLINSYLRTDGRPVEFDYSLVRPAGAPIRGFGGTASGPAPLIKLHEDIRLVIGGRAGDFFDSRAIVDAVNLIGTCVVAGNVRRSATIALGSGDDKDFVNLKNYEMFPERAEWGWMSNNTVSVPNGSRPDYEAAAERIVDNGEPGFLWLETSQQYGRLVDPANGKDARVKGTNPCAEISLESYELCNLVEIHLNNIEDEQDLMRTLKFAYLYAKSITLLPTHWQETNAVIQRNRRIGTSMTGISQFADIHGLPTLRDWFDNGYGYVQELDKQYSEWLGIRESIKTTTVKPSGTVSLLSGASPGVHWTPGGKYFLRAVRFSSNEPIVAELVGAGYKVEDDLVSANTKVAYFPIKSDNERSEQEVTIFEKIALAAETQRYWADNSVSVTVSFDPETEQKHIPTVLKMYEGKLKTVSFLPMATDVYPQQPYTQISEEEYNSYVGKIGPVSTESLYLNGQEPEGDRYCTTDVCEVPSLLVK
jgi:ribonucleoside-triphosphate reductase (thioredoxin)